MTPQKHSRRIMKRRIVSILILVTAVMGGSLSAQAQSSRGGGAFLAYSSDPQTGSRDCYGVIRNYYNGSPAKSTIYQTLVDMYNETGTDMGGQRRLTIQILHIRGNQDSG